MFFTIRSSIITGSEQNFPEWNLQRVKYTIILIIVSLTFHLAWTKIVSCGWSLAPWTVTSGLSCERDRRGKLTTTSYDSCGKPLLAQKTNTACWKENQNANTWMKTFSLTKKMGKQMTRCMPISVCWHSHEYFSKGLFVSRKVCQSQNAKCRRSQLF